MLKRKQGGDVARFAPLLALLSTPLIMCACAGCRQPEIALKGRQSVQMDALLPLHPAWAQVESLDKIRAQFAARQPPGGVVAPDLPPLPPAFTPPKETVAAAPEQRLQRAQASTEQYLKQLAEILRLQDEAYLARQARRQAQAVQATYAKELSAREAAIRAERLRQASELDRQITRLQFREVAFQTQLRVYKGQAKADAQLQADALLAQIDALGKQGDALLVASDISNLALADMKPRLRELNLQADKEREQERVNRVARREAQLQQEKSKLAFDADPLPPINATPLPAPDSRETPLVLPPGSQAGATFQAASASMGNRRARQEAEWQAQRERLMAVIRADTAKAVAQIAKQQGWNLVSEGTPRAEDETKTIMPLLRQQWMQGRSE